MNVRRSHKQFVALLPVIALLLLYLFSRAHSLLALPIVTDESDNIYWARDVWHLHLLPAANVGHVLNVWWLSLFRPFANSLWIARAATVLFGLVGLCGAYSTMRSLVSAAAGTITATLYALSPFLFFFDRLAIPEAIAVSLSALVVCTGVWFTSSGRAPLAFLSGLTLAAAVAAKASMVALLPIPLLAGAILAPKKAAKLAAWAYGAFALVWVPLGLLLTVKGYNLFGLIGAYGGSPLADLGARLPANLTFVWEQAAGYFSPPILLLALACAGYLLAVRPRAASYLLLSAALPVLALGVVARTIFGRYILILALPVVMVLGAGLALAGGALQRRLAPARPALGFALLAIVIGAWALSFALPFFNTAYTHPEDLPLPPGDRWEYIASQSSGYGRQEAVAYLAHMAEQSGTTVHAVGLVSACRSMKLILPPDADVEIDCPVIAWDGSRQHELEARVAERAAEQSPLYLLEEGLPYVSIETLPVALTELVSFPRPGAETAVTLYRVSSR